MKILLHLLLAFCGLLLIGCATPMESSPGRASRTPVDNGAAPLVLAGSKLQYRDLHGSCVYTFMGQGRYEFAAVHQSKQSEGGRKGNYTYTIIAPGKAKVSFDKEPAMTLSFDSPFSGIVSTEGDVRAFAFTITRPDGE